MASLARVLAADSMLAQPVTIFRHLHVVDEPVVLVPLTLAGETNAPLAAMVGTDRNRPRIIVTRQPRARAERLIFAQRLAGELLYPIQTMAADTERVHGVPELRIRARRAPQIWVPNPSGIDFVRLLGRMTRFRRTDGEWAVSPAVKQLGIWLTWFAEQAEFADSSVMVAATRALSAVWATGQSAIEDGNLAALMAWLMPRDDLSVAEAVRRAEDPAVCPPAGPATDPTFDRIFLEPTLRDLAEAPDDLIRARVLERLTAMLTEQIRPTWNLVWQAIDLLRAVPQARRVAARWERQRDRFTEFNHYVTGKAGFPQPKRDNAVASARRLHEMEQRQASFDAQRAYDDPLIMAEHRLLGEAFRGIVQHAEPFRQVSNPTGGRPRLRPLVTAVTDDPIRLEVGDELHDPDRSGQKAVVMELRQDAERWVLVLELQDKMGRGRQPAPGSVPTTGETVVYTKLRETYVRRGRDWPNREQIPWTHGGPPPDFVPLSDDASEDWS